MKERPEALRLADALDLDPMPMGWCCEAAAELRRLHAEVERLSWDSVHTCHAECQRPVCRLTRERDALLEALKRAADFLHHATEFRFGHPGFEQTHAKARAAIKTVEEGK